MGTLAVLSRSAVACPNSNTTWAGAPGEAGAPLGGAGCLGCGCCCCCCTPGLGAPPGCCKGGRGVVEGPVEVDSVRHAGRNAVRWRLATKRKGTLNLRIAERSERTNQPALTQVNTTTPN